MFLATYVRYPIIDISRLVTFLVITAQQW